MAQQLSDSSFIKVDDGQPTGLDPQTMSNTLPSRREIVFLDSRIAGDDRLLVDLDTHVEVIHLKRDHDGLQQIASALDKRHQIDALHLIAHGAAAELWLGNTRFTPNSMPTPHAVLLHRIGRSLSNTADILIYGCNFGRGSAGRAAAHQLAQLSGADIAVSDDPTGHASRGGNWELEYRVGIVEAQVLMGVEARRQWRGRLDVTTGLVGHWTFDTDATDASGNSYHGTLNNGASIDTNPGTNQVGNGKLSLDGVDDHVALTAHVSAFQSLSEDTVAAWIRTTPASQAIFAVSDSGDDQSYGYLRVTSSGELKYNIWENDVEQLDVESVDSFLDGNWHHVAVTVDSNGNKLYRRQSGRRHVLTRQCLRDGIFLNHHQSG